MGRKLKLDLHTHPFEATGDARPTVVLAHKIAEIIKARGLDGIAITEHYTGLQYNVEYAYQMKEMIEKRYKDIIIIPGQEVHQGDNDVLELYLPDGAIFRFVGHPSHLDGVEQNLEGIHGIEIDNYLWLLDKERIREIAQKHDLLLLSNTDAHSIPTIGLLYTYVDLEELTRRAKMR